MERSKVIVIGGNHHNTLGVIRSLGFKGLKSDVVIVTEQKKPYVSYSKYIQNCQLLTSSSQILNYLLETKSRNGTKQVIISCADFVTAVLDAHQEQLADYYYLPVGNGNLNQIMDKEIMSKIANSCGLKTPLNYTIDEASSYEKKLIIKPLKSIDGSKSDISIVNDKESLINYLSSSHTCQFQIQEYIEKSLEFQLIGCSLNGGEILIIPGVSIILRQPENTNTGFLKYVSADKFQFNNLNACKIFIQSIGYSGLFSLEFLRDKDNKDFFLEINLRNDGNAICVTSAGMNLPYIWYSYCIGSNDWIQEASAFVRDTIVMPEFDDFINVLKGKLSIIKWLKDVSRTDCFMEYDKTDKAPFYIGLWQRCASYFKYVFKKLSVFE